MPFSFMGYSQEDLVKMVWLYERIEHAKNCDGFDLDKAIEKNYIRMLKKFIEPACEYLNSKVTGEKKMTREEAVKKVASIYKYDPAYDPDECTSFVNSLEALGLIKFEEEDLTPIMYTSIPRKIYERHTAAIEEIEKAGYKIVKA